MRTPIIVELRKVYLRETRRYSFLSSKLNASAIRILEKSFVRSGYILITQDEFRMALRNPSNHSLINWIPMHLMSLTVANDTVGITFELSSDLLLAYLRKIGFTIISWKDENIDSDVLMHDAYDISNYLTSPLRSIGNKLSFKQAQLVSRISDDERTGVGHLWRESFLCYCRRNDLVYVGLGDEIESLLHAEKIFQYNIPDKYPVILTYQSIIGQEMDRARDDGWIIDTEIKPKYYIRGKAIIMTERSRIASLTSMFDDCVVVHHSKALAPNHPYFPTVGHALLHYATDPRHVHICRTFGDVPDIIVYVGMHNDFIWGRRGTTRVLLGNAFDYRPHPNELLVALFSMSNWENINPIHTVSHLSRITSGVSRSGFVISYPFEFGVGSDPRWRIKGRYLEEYVGSRLYIDHLASVPLFLRHDVNCVHGSDIESLFGHTYNGKRDLESSYFRTNRSNQMFKRYMFVTSRYLFEDRYQTWSNSQTHWARYVSVFLRQNLNLQEDMIYELRFLVVKLLDPGASRVKDPHKRITAKLSSGKYIAVSGHLINLLLFSSIGVIDMKRYLRSIKINLKLASGEKFDPLLIKYLDESLLSEDNLRVNIRELWHSYYEFYYGIATYIMMCRLFKLRCNQMMIIVCLGLLRRWKRQYPRFSGNSNEVTQFIRSQQ